MPLTRDFRETVHDRLKRDREFRTALLQEGVNCLLSGETNTGMSLLRDFVHATIGFQELGEITQKSPKRLRRMLSPSGNPKTRNLFKIIDCLQKREDVRLEVQIRNG